MKPITDKTTYNPKGERIDLKFVLKFLNDITPATDGMFDLIPETDDVADYCQKVAYEVDDLIGYLEGMREDLGAMAYDSTVQEQRV